MHFSARKNVLEYDDVMNLQRAAIYGERNEMCIRDRTWTPSWRR